eukprot:c17065_g1_i1 orf=202-1230(+)
MEVLQWLLSGGGGAASTTSQFFTVIHGVCSEENRHVNNVGKITVPASTKEGIEKLWIDAGHNARSALKSVVEVFVPCKQKVDLNVNKWQIQQGDTLAVFVAVHPVENFFEKLNIALRTRLWNDPLVNVTFGSSVVPAYPVLGDPHTWRALVPTTPLDELGTRALEVEVRDGRHKDFHGVVEILKRDFPVEYLWLNDTKSTIHGTKEEMEAVEGFISRTTTEQYWQGRFLLPTKGRVTTDYGVQRYYNGVFAERYFHRGVDYGAVEGTPVKAPANGQVVLIGEEKRGFELHGNCVGLDHGQGVTSILMHLDSICVREGMMVQAGEIVGTVGETGLATGPHLHW